MFEHNKVDIYIKEKNGTREIRVPWLPAEIKYESGDTTAASYDILNRGEVQIPTATGLAVVSWSSQLPGRNRTDDAMQRGTWQEPSYYHNILEDWRTKGTALTVLVTGYPINKDVFLSKYSATIAGGFGDLEYDIELTESRDITISVTKPDQNTANKRPAATTTSYTIKKGDTLWAISSRFLGAGSKWRTIYNANKTIIENTAKKRGYKSSNNGWWIFPGVTIQIPR